MAHPRLVARRVAELRRAVGGEVDRLRLDAGLSIAGLARESGVDPAHLWRVIHGTREASQSTLVSIADVLGADLSIRYFPTTGPRVRDRHQIAIEEALLDIVARPRWTVTPEVAVRYPARGSIDVVLHDRPASVLVPTEIESVIRRIEQLLRWHQAKADALPSADLWPFATAEGPVDVSRLLVIRSTSANREAVRSAANVLAAAFPGRAERRAPHSRVKRTGPAPRSCGRTCGKGEPRSSSGRLAGSRRVAGGSDDPGSPNFGEKAAAAASDVCRSSAGTAGLGLERFRVCGASNLWVVIALVRRR